MKEKLQRMVTLWLPVMLCSVWFTACSNSEVDVPYGELLTNAEWQVSDETAETTANGTVINVTVSEEKLGGIAYTVGVLYCEGEAMPTGGEAQYATCGKASQGIYTVTLTGLKLGTTYSYRPCIEVGGKKYPGKVGQFSTKAYEEDPIHPAVDLGLSVRWASFNIGAAKPSECGDLFAWGEVETKEKYEKTNYAWYKKNEGTLHVMGVTSQAGLPNRLNGEHDAARVKWGWPWRIPSNKEMQELIDNCKWKKAKQDGIEGYLVTSRKNGNSIFLPFTRRMGINSTPYGYYWTSEVEEKDTSCSKYLMFNADEYAIEDKYGLYATVARYEGNAIRAVTFLK